MAPKPHTDPDKVNRRGREDVLKVGFQGSHIACTAYAITANSVRDGGLNASPLGILAMIGGSLLTSAGSL
jgi:hypothetical protein